MKLGRGEMRDPRSGFACCGCSGPAETIPAAVRRSREFTPGSTMTVDSSLETAPRCGVETETGSCTDSVCGVSPDVGQGRRASAERPGDGPSIDLPDGFRWPVSR